VPNAEASLRAWLNGFALNADDFNASTILPRLALATSGGGYRSLLTGAGVIQAFDGREQTTRTPFSGLLQGMTYQAALSGGAWLLTSFAANNYPTISVLRDSLWIQRFQFSLYSINPVQLDYQAVAVAQIISKRAAGFEVTVTDVWSRDFAFQLLQAPNGGANVTFDQITQADAFKSFSVPLPIITTVQFDPRQCTPPLDASIYEFTPYSFGSWDSGIRVFTPVKSLGTTYNNGQLPANGQCVLGFDNAGFVLGTSSFLFDEIECRILPNGTLALIPSNSTSAIAAALIAQFKLVLSATETITTDNVITAAYPNPFLGNAASPKVASATELHFVDGGDSHQNIPFWPLIQPPRNVDIIFANDNSGDTNNLPDGSSIITTYMQAMRAGLPFPVIPNSNTFLSQNLNIRPAFFGCNQTNVPLAIYLPNTNISFPSAIATFKGTFTPDETNGLIQNGLNVATRSNSTQWARCVACTIARRRAGLYTINTSAECLSCFNQYCF
jgi:lysophospholipase